MPDFKLSPHSIPMAYLPTGQILTNLKLSSRVWDMTESPFFPPIRGLSCVVSPLWAFDSALGQFARRVALVIIEVVPSLQVTSRPESSIRLIDLGVLVSCDFMVSLRQCPQFPMFYFLMFELGIIFNSARF